MHRYRVNLLAVGIASAIVGTSAMTANAAIILSWSSTAGYAGTESSIPVATYGSGVVATGGAITRAAGLSGNQSGSGSLNSAGWSSGYLTFSLTTTASSTYDLTTFQVQDRASATGPRDLGLYYSGNNFTQPIATWSDAASAGTRQETATISDVTLQANTSYTFEIKATDGSANNGGSIGASGTYRIISPTLALSGNLAAVPEPASLGLLGTGALLLMKRRIARA